MYQQDECFLETSRNLNKLINLLHFQFNFLKVSQNNVSPLAHSPSSCKILGLTNKMPGNESKTKIILAN